jgi:hypothetical protein
MQTFAQYALPATIVVSAAGAVVLCVVLFLYGFGSEADVEGRSPARRLFVIRLGHAVVAACFAAAMMLGTVALLDQRHVIAPAPPVTAPPSGDLRRLETQVKTLEQRLATAELRLGDIVQPRAVVESPATGVSRPSSPPRPPRSATSSARRVAAPAAPVNGSEGMAASREQGEAMSIPPAASQQAAPAGSASTPPPEDFGTRARTDWQSVKRGFQQAGKDVRSGLTDFGRRVKETFTREAN